MIGSGDHASLIPAGQGDASHTVRDALAVIEPNEAADVACGDPLWHHGFSPAAHCDGSRSFSQAHRSANWIEYPMVRARSAGAHPLGKAHAARASSCLQVTRNDSVRQSSSEPERHRSLRRCCSPQPLRRSFPANPSPMEICAPHQPPFTPWPKTEMKSGRVWNVIPLHAEPSDGAALRRATCRVGHHALYGVALGSRQILPNDRVDQHVRPIARERRAEMSADGFSSGGSLHSPRGTGGQVERCDRALEPLRLIGPDVGQQACSIEL